MRMFVAVMRMFVVSSVQLTFKSESKFSFIQNLFMWITMKKNNEKIEISCQMNFTNEKSTLIQQVKVVTGRH